ncbi:MAG: xylulokinase [Halanaerobiales bacterium]|nr:xylulokinase [Halanaerobiales bacterium]
MSYLLGIDIGTSNVKVLIISSNGKLVATEEKSYPLYSLNQGWSEQNPQDWWSSTKTAIKTIISKNDIKPFNISSISLSGQMHSLVLLDKNKEVIRRAILWNDTRTSHQCNDILKKVGGLNKLIKLVSNPALEGFTAPKILWVRDNEPENYKKIRHILLPKDYIRYKLTKEIKSEVSDNAGTLLFDVKNKKWSKEMLKILNIDKELLPEVIKSTEVAGYITKKAAKDTGLKKDTLVIAGGADNACGAVGSGIIKNGRVMISIGTSGVVLAQSNKPVPDLKGRIHLFNHANPDKYYNMGVMLSAAGSFNWLMKNMYDNNYDIKSLNKLAAESKPGSEKLIFLPYLVGERTPHADSKARGVFFGISNKHKINHFVRSVMEGVVFGLKDSLNLIKEKGLNIDQVRVIGGGAKSKLWCQILADVIKKEVVLINFEEGPAFGAALIAGVGAGIFLDFEQAERNFIKINDKIRPNTNNYDIYDHNYSIYTGLYESLKENFKENI